jgi:hypothetical protein
MDKAVPEAHMLEALTEALMDREPSGQLDIECPSYKARAVALKASHKTIESMART